MITELLESARLNSANYQLQKTKFDLQEQLDQLVSLYQDSPPGVLLDKSASATMIYADKERLMICFRNLLENALKYSKNQNHAVEIEIQSEVDRIIITVRDFGEGIPAQDMPHIFEPFYRVDKSRNAKTGGYGLGLNLSKKIIAAHGGEISVESTPNVETLFTVSLPL